MLKVSSFQIADQIDIKAVQKTVASEPHFAHPDELFYKMSEDEFIYVFKYGVVCFSGQDVVKCSEFIQLILPHCKNPFKERLSEELEIESGAETVHFGYNRISLEKITPNTLRIVMLNVSQSVALDYYSEQADALLNETNQHTAILEARGSLDMSGKKLKRYIGKVLILKNKISEHLYIFDSPPETWEDEGLNHLDEGLKKLFDLKGRHRNIQEDIQIIKDNLELFKDIMHHNKSSMLEWIIIILIFVEIIDLFIVKLFG